jgi:hypothetical protein
MQDIIFLLMDEAWFHLSGFINSQNYRIWSAYNLNNVIEVQLHPIKIGGKELTDGSFQQDTIINYFRD